MSYQLMNFEVKKPKANCLVTCISCGDMCRIEESQKINDERICPICQ